MLSVDFVLNFNFKSVVSHSYAEFCEDACGLLGGNAVDVGTHMACDVCAALAHYAVFVEGCNEQAHHGDRIVRADAEVSGLFTAGGVENRAVDGQSGPIKITPLLARQSAAVKTVEELLSILFKNVVKRLLLLARDVV